MANGRRGTFFQTTNKTTDHDPFSLPLPLPSLSCRLCSQSDPDPRQSQRSLRPAGGQEWHAGERLPEQAHQAGGPRAQSKQLHEGEADGSAL